MAPPIDESCRRRFEAARLHGDDSPLAGFLPHDPTTRAATLEELVLIEHELRVKSWRREGAHGTAPALADVAAPFEELQSTEVRQRLLAECAWLHDEDGHPRIGSRIGPYRLLGLLGTGAFARVWRAADPRLGREVALKVPRAELRAERGVMERVAREARAAAPLAHPGIVQVYEVGEHDGLPYVASELVAGPTLEAAWAEARPPPRAVAATVRRLAEALAYAHAKGVVHRDVKPANVLLHPTRGPVLADFGLASLPEAGAGVTREGDLLGTPAYMAPEQASGQHDAIGERTDVYALGALLFEGLAGRRPFQRASVPATLHAILHEDPPSLADRGTVPGDLEAICRKAMAREPGRRYANAAALAADLDRFLGHRPVLARRPSPLERMLLSIRRRPALAALGGLALLAVAATATWGYLGIRAERDQLRIAELEQRRGLLRALTSEAHTLLRTRPPGFDRDALARLRKALPLAEAADRGPVRNLAIEALGPLDPTLSVLEVLRAPSRVAVRHVALDAQGTIAWLARDGRLELHRADRPVEQAVVAEAQTVCALLLHPEGRYLLLARADGRLEQWSQAPLAPLAMHPGLPLATAAMDARGTVLALGRADGRVDLVALGEAAPGAPLRTLAAHTGPVRSLAFSPDGTHVASGGEDRVMRLFEVDGGGLVHEVRERPGAVLAVAADAPGWYAHETGDPGWLGAPEPRTYSGAAALDFAPHVARVDVQGARSTGRPEHAEAIVALCYVRAWLVSVAGDGSIDVRDARGGRLRLHDPGRLGRLDAVAFAPAARAMVTAHADGRVARWSLGGGAAHLLATHHACAFVPGTHDLAGDAGLFRPADGGYTLDRFVVPRHVAICRDAAHGEALFVSDAGVITRRDLAPPHERRGDLATGLADTTCADCAGATLVLGGAHGRVWLGQRTATGWSGTTVEPRVGAVHAVAAEAGGSEAVALLLTERGLWRLAPDGTCTPVAGVPPGGRALAASAGARVVAGPGGALFLVSGPDAASVRRIPPHAAAIEDLALSADGTQLAVVSRDALALVELPLGRVVRRLEVPGITWARFDARGARLLTGGRVVTVLDPAAGTWLGRLSLYQSHDGLFVPQDTHALVSAPSGSWSVDTGGRSGTLNASAAPELPSPRPLGATGMASVCWSLAASPDGTLIATSEQWGGVTLWDAATRGIRRVLVPSGEVAWRVAFSPDAARLAAGTGSTVRLFDVTTGAEVQRLEAPTSLVLGMAFDPVRARLVTSEQGGTVRSFDLDTGRQLASWHLTDVVVRDLAFRPDGAQLALACDDGCVRLCPTDGPDAGLTPAVAIQAHPGRVGALAFSADGTWLASAGSDGEIVVRDGATLEPLFDLPARVNVRALSFSSDGRYVASASWLTGLVVWDLHTLRRGLEDLGLDLVR